MELDLVELLDKHPNVSCQGFLACCDKIAKCKWPNEQKKRPLTAYQQFVKDNMKQVMQDFPDLAHKDRMRVIASMWKQKGLVARDANE